MSHLSFEIPYMFNELIVSNDIKGAIKLVDECFEQFPKEPDSITKVILDGLLESAESGLMANESVPFIKLLLKHLDILYTSYVYSNNDN